MKRYLLMLSFLCMTVPQTADAESILDTGASFQLAKTVKLGRELIINNTGNAKVGGGSTAVCGANCASCNTATKQCMQCSNNTYALNNGKCQKCSDTLSNCVLCSSVAVCSKCATGYQLVNNKCEKRFAVKKINSDGSLSSTSYEPVSQLSSYFLPWPDLTPRDEATGGAVNNSTQTVVLKCAAGSDFWKLEDCVAKASPLHKYCSNSGLSCNFKLEDCMRDNCSLCDNSGKCQVCEEFFSPDDNGNCVPSNLILRYTNSDGSVAYQNTVDHDDVSNYFNAQAGLQIFDADTNGAVNNSTQTVVLKCSGNGLGDFWDEASCKMNLPSGQTCAFSPQNTCQFSRSASSFPVVIRDTKGSFSTSVENSSSSSIADLAYELKSKYSYTLQSCAANGNQIECTCISSAFASKANCEANFAANSAKTCVLPYGQNYFCPYFVSNCPSNCATCSAYGTVPVCSVCKDGYKLNANAGCDRANISVVIRDAKSSISTTVDSTSSSLDAAAKELKNKYSGTVQSCSVNGEQIECNCVSSAFVSKANCEASFQANTGKTCLFPYGQTAFCPYFAGNCNQANCAACIANGTQTTCTQCKDGYSLNNNTCVNPCGSGSNMHVGIDGTEYCFSTGMCPDNSQSATSQGQKTVCSCKFGYKAAGPRCVPIGIMCPAGQYIDTATQQCKKCPDGCSECTSATKCTACTNGGSPLNGRCPILDIEGPTLIDACDGTSSTPRYCSKGLIRVPGRGCCPSDYASKPGYACYQCAVDRIQ